MTEVLTRNQKIKDNRGGKRQGAGRKKGAIQKLGAVELLDSIHKVTGKPFARSIAEHYHKAAQNQDWNAVRDYEKFILSKVLSDRQEVDITSGGEQLKAIFNFPTVELPDWK
jgi:hypothetical protein